MAATVPEDIIGNLRAALSELENKRDFQEILTPKNTVLARFRPVFSPEHVAKITAEEFHSFLLFENNRHWSGLHRQSTRICADMKKLKEALCILVDEEQPLAERLDKATEMIPGMGKNIASAILLITNPNYYGVWNNRSEANMKRLGIWPHFNRGESFGKRYVKVNQILLQLRDSLETDLWTLDVIWWYLDVTTTISPESGLENTSSPLGTFEKNEQRFGLERYLHEFIRDNWDQLDLGHEWAIYKEEGDEEAGYEYPCEVGRIDLLAKHRQKRSWLVIELKRNQTSDQTVGQLLRYIGWVKQHLADKDEHVQGMIICRGTDKSLEYALSTLQDVELRLYEVEFHLKKT